MGGSRRFCVQCGQQLKPDSRFCVACGHAATGVAPPRTGQTHSEQVTQTNSEQVTTASGYEATSTMPVPAQDDAVHPSSPAADLTWPSKDSYRPANSTPEPVKRALPPSPAEFSPSPGEFPSPPDKFSPLPDEFPPPPAEAAGLFGLRDRPPSQPRSRRPFALVVALLVPAVIAAVVVFFVLRPSHATRPSAAATPTSAGDQRSVQATSATPSASSASSSAHISERQAATSLAGLLRQSVADRSSIKAAVSDVNQCGPSLNQDPQMFQSAATSHQQLLSQLSSLPGRSALPAAMLQSLTSAWQASAAADKDLGQWAQDEVSNGCTQNDQADTNFQAAVGPDGQATTEKKAFVSQWDSIASQYGLTTYQWNQL